VLRALATGLTNREIGRILNIGERTVKTHVSHLLSKLGLQSRTQAALYAVRIGLVPSPGSAQMTAGQPSRERAEEPEHASTGADGLPTRPSCCA